MVDSSPPAAPEVELIIQFIDEMTRGRSRLTSVIARMQKDARYKGLAATVLTAVVRAGTPPTVPQIGRSLGLPRQTIQRHVDQLVADGMVRLVHNPDHKRAMRLEATDAGRACYARSNDATKQWAVDFVEGMDRDALAKTVATMREIRKKLETEARHQD